jgi:DNA-3-methyladenine glycosylase
MLKLPPLATADFCAQPAPALAPALIGCLLVRDNVVLRITETEAYFWPGDTACHARSGPTPRTTVMWGPAGRAYVYLCYGIHNLINIVADQDGMAAAVLIRAAEPVDGIDTILERRGLSRLAPSSLAGPGKVGQALALDSLWSHHDMLAEGGLELRRAFATPRVIAGTRIGIGYADSEHQALALRFADADSPWVSHRKAFGPTP